MPVKKIQKKCDLDKFYTDPSVAQLCVDFLNYCIGDDNVNLIYVEPSAGAGYFSNLVEGVIAYDIDPAIEGIEQQDWLTWEKDFKQEWVMFGNPPFGNANSLSKKFIKKGIEQGCSYVGFVLPASYKKFTTQKVFPCEWDILGTIDLPESSFLLEGNPYHVPCVFQVWKKDVKTGNRAVKGKDYCKDIDFRFTKNNGDYFLFGASPAKIIPANEVTKNNRGYYFKTNLDLQGLRGKMSNINWKEEAMSSVNGGVSWFTKDEIIKIWEKYYGN